MSHRALSWELIHLLLFMALNNHREEHLHANLLTRGCCRMGSQDLSSFNPQVERWVNLDMACGGTSVQGTTMNKTCWATSAKLCCLMYTRLPQMCPENSRVTMLMLGQNCVVQRRAAKQSRMRKKVGDKGTIVMCLHNSRQRLSKIYMTRGIWGAGCQRGGGGRGGSWRWSAT